VDTTLEEALRALGLDGRTPALDETNDRCERVVEHARKSLVDRLGDNLPVDVLVVGGVARRDAIPQGDVEYLVVSHGPLHEPHDLVEVLTTIGDVWRDLGLHAPDSPPASGRFVAAADLVERIGLVDDTDEARTNRVRALTESVSVYRPDLRDELVAAMVRHYAADYERGKRGVPRPLVNDVLWRWRTTTLASQAKRWGAADDPWGPRYLELIVPAKIAVAGTVSTLFRCEEPTAEYFAAEFALPPLARLAALHGRLRNGGQAALRTVLEVAENYAAVAGEEGFRAEARLVRSRREIDEHPHYRRMIIRARELQAALETIFLDTPVVAEKARKYLSF
jgi:hypothetical protein